MSEPGSPDHGQPATGKPEDWFDRLLHMPEGGVAAKSDRTAAGRPEAPPTQVVPDAQAPAAKSAANPLAAQSAAAPVGDGNTTGATADERVQAVPVSAIWPNPAQPRRDFDEAELGALADSIVEQGVMQPVLVRPLADQSGQYQIIAGERRWRAARMAGLDSIPAIVRDVDDVRMAEIALVENIQRADLSPLDEAAAYQKLIDRHDHTQEGLARRLGKNRSHIAHMLRLLRLPPTVQTQVRSGLISVGHARLLVSAENPQAVADRIVAEGLTVRQTEQALKLPVAKAGDRTKQHPPPISGSSDGAAWAARFGAALDRPVAVKPGRKGGSVVIRYDSDDDLAAILARMGG